MTTVPGSYPHEFGPLADRLEQAAQRFRAAAVVGGAGKAVAILVPLAAAIILTAGLLNVSPFWRLVLLMLWLAAAAACYLLFLHRAIWRQPTFSSVARSVEEHSPAEAPLNNQLINAVLLAEEFRAGGPARKDHPWVRQLLTEVNRRTASHDLQKAAPMRDQLKWWYAAMAAIVVVLLTGILLRTPMSRGMQVLFSTRSFVPQVGKTRIVRVAPGNASMLAGQSVVFTVRVRAPGHALVPVTLHLRFAGGKSAVKKMVLFGQKNNRYRYTLPAAAESMRYFVRAGHTESQQFTVRVLPHIGLTSLTTAVTPPAYTHEKPVRIALAAKNITAAAASLAVPLGSRISFAAALSYSIPNTKAVLRVAGGKDIPLHSSDGQHFQAKFTLAQTIRYRIVLSDATGRILTRLPEASGGTASRIKIAAVADQAPLVHWVQPRHSVQLTPGTPLLLAASATDDYGVLHMRLAMARGNGPFATVRRWDIPNAENGLPQHAPLVRARLNFPKNLYQAGQDVRLRVSAVDNRAITMGPTHLGPQTARSRVLTVHLVSQVLQVKNADSTRWQKLQALLMGFLTTQRALRTQASPLLKAMPLPAARALAGVVQTGQSHLRHAMRHAVRHFAFAPRMALVQQALKVLVAGDAASAVNRARDLVLLQSAQQLPPIARVLHSHQVRVIDVLESLLAIAHQHTQSQHFLLSHQGAHVPNRGNGAWRKLLASMKKLEKQQQGVINTTASLAKKPRDQYTAKDLAKLVKAAATEDKWHNFMHQAVMDMSNISEQDQANASLLDDMVQMNVELAMAKNALKAKLTKIATPLEANGLEDAKKLDSHIEQWLMQAPDRNQWEMEDPVSQNDVPAPDLPAKLQDMIGKLMDNQEDLTQQMESLGSKWSDSVNKGNGWGAADGPISDMSAQGVTGNQMPRNDEIQGRSGEGREGRASGEMVGSTAVGKGGRRTPTRLTNEPFSNGIVKDTSKMSPGGATGGGKQNGWGARGLEGPSPQFNGQLKRMAQRQAQLRQQANRLSIQLHAQTYGNFKLFEAAVLMRDAAKSLRKYDYHTALLYQKQAVRTLNTAKVLNGAQLHVTMDNSPTMRHKQRKMAAAGHGTLPRGYGNPVRAYFSRLSGQ